MADNLMAVFLMVVGKKMNKIRDAQEYQKVGDNEASRLSLLYLNKL